MGTNFKLQVVKQSEDAEDEAVAVFQPKGPAPATNDFTGLVNASPFFLLIFNKLRLHLTHLDNSGIYWLKVDDLTLACDLLTRNVSKV